jgi:predicted esterase
MKRSALLLLSLFLAGNGSILAKTQKKPGYLKRKAQIIFVGKRKKGKKYPLVVFLPFTGGNAHSYFEHTKKVQPWKNYVAVIPQGTTQREHYLPDFWSFVKWYEARLLKDIKRARKKYKVNSSRIYMEGFSLGGDLGWALMVRQKKLFKGVHVIGSRTSYPLRSEDLAWFKKKGKRIALSMGKQDLPARKKGMKNVRNKLKAGKVKYIYREFQGEHSVPTWKQYRKILKWMAR